MNKNLKELKEISDERLIVDYFDKEVVKVLVNCFSKQLIKVLEDFEKRLKAIEIELGIYTEEEIKKIKIGGTDPN